MNKDLLIRVADWQTEKNDLSEIRRLVFIEEQQVPETLEWDEFDTTATHFLALVDNIPVATARLKADGQIGRMAVLPEYRRQGIGYQLMRFALQSANEQRMTEVYLHAQVSAISFYERHEFTSVGDIFYEANIPHREMLKKLC